MKNDDKLTEIELLEAIKRSGYLLESEIANNLSRNGFFVESNQVIVDPKTGKSRELDLIAEYFDRSTSGITKNKVCAKIKFVFEIKNNIYPLVLLTKFEFSPDTELWSSTKEIQTLPKGINSSSTKSYYEKLLDNNEPIFTQYCSFEVKKTKGKEILATHPEQIYSGLSKITQYCEEAVDSWGDFEEGDTPFYRKFLYLPILLIKDDLYELEIKENGEPKLHQVDESKLIFNYHHNDEPKIATIWIVTKAGFSSFIDKMVHVERQLEFEMKIAKTKQKKA